MSFMRPGPMELIIILVVVLIIFGVGKLPEIGGAMGKAIKEFRNTQKDGEDDRNQETAPISPSDKEEKSSKK